MPVDVLAVSDIHPGDFYEDCFYHPCLCMRVEDDEVAGISLVDGSLPRCCGVRHCGIRRLTADEAIEWKLYGPPFPELSPEAQWWPPFAREAVMYRPQGRGGDAAT